MEQPPKISAYKKPGRFKALWVSFGLYGAVLLVLVSFVGGVVLGQSQEKAAASQVGKLTNKGTEPSYVSKDVDMSQFWKVWDTVKSTYLRTPVEDPKMFYGSIKGMVASLGDPYSVYFDPQEAASFSSQLEGTFDGIGAEIGFRDSQMIIVSPLPGTPAIKAGLKAGDAILKINGEDTTGMAIDIAITKIRGPKGTTVTLNIARASSSDPFDVTITRDKITVDSVQGKMIDDKGKDTDASGGIAYISISEFNQDTVAEFDAALSALLLRDPKGIILDLRGDPVGYLDAAVEVPRDWVGAKPVVIQRKGDGTENADEPDDENFPDQFADGRFGQQVVSQRRGNRYRRASGLRQGDGDRRNDLWQGFGSGIHRQLSGWFGLEDYGRGMADAQKTLDRQKRP